MRAALVLLVAAASAVAATPALSFVERARATPGANEAAVSALEKYCRYAPYKTGEMYNLTGMNFAPDSNGSYTFFSAGDNYDYYLNVCGNVATPAPDRCDGFALCRYTGVLHNQFVAGLGTWPLADDTATNFWSPNTNGLYYDIVQYTSLSEKCPEDPSRQFNMTVVFRYGGEQKIVLDTCSATLYLVTDDVEDEAGYDLCRYNTAPHGTHYDFNQLGGTHKSAVGNKTLYFTACGDVQGQKTPAPGLCSSDDNARACLFGYERQNQYIATLSRFEDNGEWATGSDGSVSFTTQNGRCPEAPSGNTTVVTTYSCGSSTSSYTVSQADECTVNIDVATTLACQS